MKLRYILLIIFSVLSIALFTTLFVMDEQIFYYIKIQTFEKAFMLYGSFTCFGLLFLTESEKEDGYKILECIYFILSIVVNVVSIYLLKHSNLLLEKSDLFFSNSAPFFLFFYQLIYKIIEKKFDHKFKIPNKYEMFKDPGDGLLTLLLIGLSLAGGIIVTFEFL